MSFANFNKKSASVGLQPTGALQAQQQNTQHSDIKVANAPNDCISSLALNGTVSSPSTLMAATAWDGTVSAYEIQYSPQGMVTNVMARHQVRHDAPALCCDINPMDGTTVYSGGCDKTVRMFNAAQPGAQPQTIGQHDAPVRCMKYLPEKQLLLTGSWDQTVRLWDTRSPTAVATLAQPDRVCCLDARGQVLVVGTINNKFLIYDLNAGNLMFDIPSPLAYQARCVSIFQDLAGFAIGGIEGRVALEYFDEFQFKGKTLPPGSPKLKTFAFKCHRENKEIFPVNAVHFHPRNTFLTAGGDGCLYTWDKDVRHKLGSLENLKFQLPIVDAKFSPMGNILVYAASYDWSRGAENYDASKGHHIYVHQLQPTEYEPKDPRTIKK